MSRSAASRVFRVPELVALIVSECTQPDLATLALVNRAVSAECQRVLYKSPWSDTVRGQDDRLNARARAVRRHRNRFNDLGLSFGHDAHPDTQELHRLFTACAPLSELELGGKHGGVSFFAAVKKLTVK